METNQVIDTVIAESQAEPVSEVVENATEQQTDETPEQKAPEREEWGPKARNAVAKRDRKIGRYEAELRQMRQELERLRGTGQPKVEEPSPDKFETYAEYNKAQTEFLIKQQLSESQKAQQEQHKSVQQQQWVAERDQSIEAKTANVLKQFPDAQNLLAENVEVVSALAEKYEDAFYQLDASGVDVSTAIYNLAKSNTLHNLLEMPPMMAVAEIVNASRMTPQKPITKAPAPINGVSGVRGGSRGVEAMSGTELLKWMNS